MSTNCKADALTTALPCWLPSLSPLLFAIAMELMLENAREGLMNEILYVDDLVLMSKSI